MEEKESNENGKKGVSEWEDKRGEGGDGGTGKGRSVTLTQSSLYSTK